MNRFRDIFKILLLLQVCSLTWAQFYGHPDAETIDVGRSSSRDHYIIEAAIRRGMDGEAIAELLRTKQPVVKVKAEPNGTTKTTTYKLEPDGSISSKTITEAKSVQRYDSGSLPDSVALDDILKSPSGTVTRTFTDENGAKVTQTFGISKPKTTSIFDSEDNDDWSNPHFPVWNADQSPFGTWPSASEEQKPKNVHKTIKTYVGPNGEKRVVESWSSEPEIAPNNPWFQPTKWSSDAEEPTPTNYHKTTKTFSGPHGETHVVKTWSSNPEISEEPTPTNFHKTTKTYSWPHDDSHVVKTWSSDPETPEKPTSINFHKKTTTYTGPNEESHVVKTWSSDPEIPSSHPTFSSPKWPFDFLNVSQPWQPSDTMGEPDEWTVVEGNPDVETTTKHKIQSWTPKTWNYPEFSTFDTTTTAKPPKQPMQPKVTTPLPTLDDFLRSQYGHTATTTATTTARSNPSSIPTTTTKPITIRIEDLPVTQILHNGQEADDSIIRMLAPDLIPTLDTGNVLKIQNKQPIESETEPKKVQTSVHHLTKTHVGSSKPMLKDLDPQMQEILRNAGISPDDITGIDGDTITKTRREPDGRVITTTYKVRTSPSVANAKPSYEAPQHYTPVGHPSLPSSSLTPNTYSSSPISEFLAKFGLTKSDISSKHGEYTNTIIDDDGQVLTATFVLSAPINMASKKKPFK